MAGQENLAAVLPFQKPKGMNFGDALANLPETLEALDNVTAALESMLAQNQPGRL